MGWVKRSGPSPNGKFSDCADGIGVQESLFGWCVRIEPEQGCFQETDASRKSYPGGYRAAVSPDTDRILRARVIQFACGFWSVRSESLHGLYVLGKRDTTRRFPLKCNLLPNVESIKPLTNLVLELGCLSPEIPGNNLFITAVELFRFVCLCLRPSGDSCSSDWSCDIPLDRALLSMKPVPTPVLWNRSRSPLTHRLLNRVYVAATIQGPLEDAVCLSQTIREHHVS